MSRLMRGILMAGGPKVDPNWSSVSALLRFNGTDGSQAFVDDTGKTWTAGGNAQMDTSAYVFGGASAFFDGAGDYILSSTDAALGLATGDFTIEGFFLRSSLGTDQGLYVRGLLSGGLDQSSLAHAIFFSADNKINFRIYSGSSNLTITSAATFTDTTFHHFAFCNDGGTLRAFVDGVSVGTLGGYSSQNDSATWRTVIGSFGPSWGIHYSGRLDSVRLTKGVCRYSADFTPPDQPFGGP